MNPIIRKFGFTLGIIVALLQVLITLYLYYYGSFVDTKFGFLILFLNIIFGIVTLLIVKKRQNKIITLRESFSSYLTPILISLVVSSLFYVIFFNTLATTTKKEEIKKELLSFQIDLWKKNNTSAAEIKTNMELYKNHDPFSIATSVQSFLKYIIMYSVLGILISFVLKSNLVPSSEETFTK